MYTMMHILHQMIRTYVIVELLSSSQREVWTVKCFCGQEQDWLRVGGWVDLRIHSCSVWSVWCGGSLMLTGKRLAGDRGWRDLVLFYEFYNPDTGQGHGARYVRCQSVTHSAP